MFTTDDREKLINIIQKIDISKILFGSNLYGIRTTDWDIIYYLVSKMRNYEST